MFKNLKYIISRIKYKAAPIQTDDAALFTAVVRSL